LADAPDSKSGSRKAVWVQVPPPAPLLPTMSQALSGPLDSRRAAQGSSSERNVTNSTYTIQWERMRRISRRLLFACVIGPLVFLFRDLFISTKNRLTPGLGVFSIAWLALLFWTIIEYRHMPCPRCGKPWQKVNDLPSWMAYYSTFLRHECPHCGLELPE
jgi:hypothetical protein